MYSSCVLRSVDHISEGGGGVLERDIVCADVLRLIERCKMTEVQRVGPFDPASKACR